MSNPLRIVLTGCASGIGRHLTIVLAGRGHRILATDVNEAALADAAKSFGWVARGVVTRKLDVTREADWEAALDASEAELGGIDVVMNVAGYLAPGYVQDIVPRDVDLHFDVNVKGVVYGTRAAARRMIPKRAGHIVNIGSLASLSPVPGLSLYAASKFAVRGFTLSVAAELRPQGVAVTLIMPDAVDTPMLDKQIPCDEAALTFSGDKALTVEDIARLVVDHVLPNRPLEAALPASRGLLARLANTAPEMTLRLAPSLLAKGRKRQDEIRRERG